MLIAGYTQKFESKNILLLVHVERSERPYSEDTRHRGKYHSAADLLFDWFGKNKKICC